MNVKQVEKKVATAASSISAAIKELSDVHKDLMVEVMSVDPSSEYGRAFDELTLSMVRAQCTLCSVLGQLPDDVFGRLLESQGVEVREPMTMSESPLIASGI